LGIGIPPSVGFPGSRDQNLGQLDNWGWEAAIAARVYEGDDVQFGLNITASMVDNEIRDLGSFAGSNNIRNGLPYPNYMSRRIILSGKLDPNGYVTDNYNNKYSGTCDAGVQKVPGDPQYGYKQGGAEVDCKKGAPPRIMQGRAFDKYIFSVNPTISLMNTLQLTLLSEGKYGRWQASNQGCGIMGCYSNDYMSRAQTDAAYVVAGRYGGQDSEFDAAFWKLREVGLRWTLPEAVISRIGAERASLSFSARELWIMWQRQEQLYSGGCETADLCTALTGNLGLNVEDPEQGRRGAASAAWRTMPANTTINATLRVTF